MRTTTLLLISGLTLAVTACGNLYAPSPPDGDPPGPALVAVEGVRVTPQSLQLFRIGESHALVAAIVPANATDRGLTWESSDSTVATVDSTGVVTARGAGQGVFVTAFTHDGGYQASVNVGVFP